MRVYISGPMTGDENYVFKFARRARYLEGLGHTVVNPVLIAMKLEVELDRKPSYEECMEADLAELAKCDAVSYLPGWENSNGAKREKEKADSLGLKEVIVYEFGGSRW